MQPFGKIAATLLGGATLILGPVAERSGEDLVTLIRKHNVTHAHVPHIAGKSA